MTHDELLERLRYHGGLAHTNPYEYALKHSLSSRSPWYNALRAVVKLHKPKEFEFNDQPVLVCGHCQLGVVGDTYPCETIQAIEKEMK